MLNYFFESFIFCFIIYFLALLFYIYLYIYLFITVISFDRFTLLYYYETHFKKTSANTFCFQVSLVQTLQVSYGCPLHDNIFYNLLSTYFYLGTESMSPVGCL